MKALGTLKWTIFPILLGSVALIGVHYTFFLVPVSDSGDRITVTVKSGTPVSKIASDLVEAGIIDSPKLFKFLARVRGVDRKLKAGRYEFIINQPEPLTVDMLVQGGVTGERVTIPEGLTLEEIASICWHKASIDSSVFVSLARDPAFTESLGVRAASLEGYLFPDTYDVPWGMAPSSLLRMMVARLYEVLCEVHKGEIDRSRFTLHEILTMASMVEREARTAEERPIIAGVLYNRLRIGMLLQCDATVQYALPEYKEQLTYADLEVRSPYNTYLHYGMPPGPIGNPGQGAIMAALYPQETEYLYYVAKGDGSHIFSRTQREHARAKVQARIERQAIRRN
jgi:UPF0755 protein